MLLIRQCTRAWNRLRTVLSFLIIVGSWGSNSIHEVRTQNPFLVDALYYAILYMCFSRSYWYLLLPSILTRIHQGLGWFRHRQRACACISESYGIFLGQISVDFCYSVLFYLILQSVLHNFNLFESCHTSRESLVLDLNEGVSYPQLLRCT